MAEEVAFYVTERSQYQISTEPGLLDLDVIHDYLHHSYWSPGVPREAVQKSIAHSLNFGMYLMHNGIHDRIHKAERTQVGFARVVTDYTSFAYLADVFVLPTHRGQGLGVWLIESIIACPLLETLRSFALATRDAHELYRKFGFAEIESSRYMIKRYDVTWRQPELARE